MMLGFLATAATSRRHRSWPVGFVAAAALALAAPASPALAQTLPVYAGVTATPSNITAPGQVLTISGPGTPGGQGCRNGAILARTSSQPVEAARPLVVPADLDADWTFGATKFENGPFTPGTYLIVLDCKDDQGRNPETFDTDAIFTVQASATTTTAATTSSTSTSSSSSPGSTVPPSTEGTVDPSTAKPGVTVLTVRGGGFAPDKPLAITLATNPVIAVASTQSTASGAYAATLTLPVTSPPGAQRLAVTGPGADGTPRTTLASITVQDLDCVDFTPRSAAQAALGPGGSDPHGLDVDGDGTACETVSARSSTGGAAPVAAPSGNLPQTGSRHAPMEVAAGLIALTFGALLLGLSHPSVPISDEWPLPAPSDRRRRGPARGRHLRR